MVSTVVEGIGQAVGRHGVKGHGAQRIEAAMREAVLACIAEGITDADVIRERQLAARVKTQMDLLSVEHAANASQAIFTALRNASADELERLAGSLPELGKALTAFKQMMG